MITNIFEPTLEVQHPTFDYNRLQIQGTFPRNQQIPTDMFPTYSVMAGIHNDKQEGKVATFTEDNRLRVDSAGGGGGGVQPAVMEEVIVSVQAFTRGPAYQLSIIPAIGNILYGYSISIGWSEPLSNFYAGGIFRIYVFNETTNGELTLCHGMIADWSTGTHDYSTPSAGKSLPFNQTVMYPIPRDITSFIAGDPNNLEIDIQNTQNLIEAQIALYVSPA